METEEIRIYVVICRWGINIGGFIDTDALVEYAKTLPNVVESSNYISLCTEGGAVFIKEKMEETNSNRLVVCACTPITHEPVFKKVLEDTVVDPSYLEFCNIREHSSLVHMHDKEGALKVAKDLLRSAVARAAVLEKILIREVDVLGKCLIIGGGVAGLKAANELGDQDYEVFLVEKEPTIGGKMAMLDRTFPTDDCSIWILGPVMLDVARNENVKLYTYSEVSKISGYIGNFSVEINQRARYVNNDCNGCGACMDVCPAYGYNEFNQGLNPRPAIYISFPQAVPSIAQIDMNQCIKCGLCESVCELEAIDFDQQPEIIKLDVGTIIVATGWDEYIPEDGYLGYNKYDNVITQLQLERILAPNGPTNGHLVRPSDGKEPKRILFIQCVGSRDLNRNAYCSSGVCCMISIKNSKLIKQHYPDAEITIAYMDMRAAGKYYEEYYTASRKEGIKYLRSNISRVYEDPETKNLKVLIQDTLRETLGVKEKEYDLIILSAAMIPDYDISALIKTLKLEVSPDGFFKERHARLEPIETKIPGISLAGVAQGPKSIAESIMQAGGAASSAGKLMKRGKYKIELITGEVDKEKCSKCGLCILNCPYDAIKMVEDGAEVDEIACRGCGSCLANCPSEAITLRYYREVQYEDQIDALLEGTKEEVA